MRENTGEPDAAALEMPSAGEKAVQAREFVQRPGDRAEEQVEGGGRSILGAAAVQLGRELARRHGFDLLREEDVRLVPRRHEERKHAAQAVQVRKSRQAVVSGAKGHGGIQSAGGAERQVAR